MLLMSISQLLSRALAYALIVVSTGMTTAALVWVLENFLFFIYKISTRDFVYASFPASPVTIILSLIHKLFAKILNDFVSLSLFSGLSLISLDLFLSIHLF
jgi:hypothetical protein